MISITCTVLVCEFVVVHDGTEITHYCKRFSYSRNFRLDFQANLYDRKVSDEQFERFFVSLRHVNIIDDCILFLVFVF